ncbi:hypothetical protein H0H92_012739, partial [Tricholoma furcatifolium]
MALWLQRREAMRTRETFCKWVDYSRADAFPIINEEDDELGGGDDDAANEDMLTHVDIPPLCHSPSPTLASRTSYALAKCTPFRNVTVDQLVTEFGAVDFIPALTTFLRTTFPRTSIFPNQFDTFNLYKQIIITHLPNLYLGSHQVTSRIRTTPHIEAIGHKLETPAHFDTAFIIANTEEYRARGGVTGLCVAQVHAIFKLPHQFGFHLHPLAYIEWFTPLGRPHPITGMYTITRSTRYQRRNAAVVSVTRIVRGCHLIGKSAATIDRGWTTNNVLEKASHFL